MAKEVVLEKVARIEGLLNLAVVIREGRVAEARAEALEGTRLLERILLGRDYEEVPDLASRMCGVCQAIHRVTSVQALERALGVELPEQLELLRELVAIGGHLQSHILHLYFFVLPDFMGRSSVFELLPSHEPLIRRVLRLKRIANAITEIVGGRAVHPVTPVVGGFTSLPSRLKLERALALAKAFRDLVEEPVRLILSLEAPEFERRTAYVSLRGDGEIPLLKGPVAVSGRGEFQPHEYERHIRYVTESYSMARHYTLSDGSEYMVGALARLNNNYHNLSDGAREMAASFSVKFPSYSPFDNNRAQALELVHFAERAIEILDALLESPPGRARIGFEVHEGEGVAVTEAPRGLLIHHYRLDARGRVTLANIVTPTAQNYKNLEADAREFVTVLLKQGVEDLERKTEMLIRAYDPCVSCSARFFREH
mgnify:CR=1 FL=1